MTNFGIFFFTEKFIVTKYFKNLVLNNIIVYIKTAMKGNVYVYSYRKNTLIY